MVIKLIAVKDEILRSRKGVEYPPDELGADDRARTDDGAPERRERQDWPNHADSADSDTELSGNKLVGTLAPTYLAEETAYGLSGNQFFLNNAGTINTNRAYLPASELSTCGNVKALTFIFETVDGIKTVEQVSAEEAAEIFNLAGQRLQKAQRGVNIINGKKVLVK